MAKLIQEIVHLHALVNLSLHFLDLDANVSYVLLCVGHFINGSWWLLDFFANFSKSGSE